MKPDNRIANLRLATNEENGRNRGAQANNTSGYKGVAWHKRGRGWQARIHTRGKNNYLGLYAKAAKELHGEYARVI